MPPQKIALVIGSGGVKCAAAIGLQRVLRQADIEPALIVGCSGGSIYASVFALGMEPEQAHQVTLEFWTSELMAGYATNLKAAISGELRFTERSGLVDDRAMLAVLQKFFGDAQFSQTKQPLFVVSTDFYTGQQVVHDSGRIFDAIRASVAVPTIFPPWEVNGQLLLDGAVSNPLPIDVAIREGATIILAIAFEQAIRPRIRSLTAANSHLNSLYMNNLLKAQFAFHNLSHHHEIILILPDFTGRVSTFDVHQLPAIIEAGEQTMKQHLPYLQRLLHANP